MELKISVKNIIMLTFCTLMTGCTHSDGRDGKTKIKEAPTPSIYTYTFPTVRSGKGISHLEQCNRDLESLRTVSQVDYRKFLAQYDSLIRNSANFMAVKDDMSPEIAELARPKFQFALVNLCYRIKNTLAQTLISQAGGAR